MKRTLVLLALAFSATVWSWPAPESQEALASRAQESMRVANDRTVARYAENNRRCQAALRIAELCGKYAGMFYCDARGFKSIPEAARVKQVERDRFEMDRCAMQAREAGSP